MNGTIEGNATFRAEDYGVLCTARRVSFEATQSAHTAHTSNMSSKRTCQENQCGRLVIRCGLEGSMTRISGIIYVLTFVLMSCMNGAIEEGEDPVTRKKKKKDVIFQKNDPPEAG